MDVGVTDALCVYKTSALRSAKDFEGQTIALGTLVSLTSVALKMWLTRNGADLASVRFVAAIYETARWANQNRDQSATIISKYSKLEVDVIRHTRRTVFATTLEPGLVQPVLDAAFAYKAIDRPTNAADLLLRG